jgi:hypothetical protein
LALNGRADYANAESVYTHGIMTNQRTWWGTEIDKREPSIIMAIGETAAAFYHVGYKGSAAKIFTILYQRNGPCALI